MKERVKIKTKLGRIVTLTISKKTEDQIFGIDKFGKDVILSLSEIAYMLPLTKKEISDG